jgi:outer membrane biosynthesis protein TonB
VVSLGAHGLLLALALLAGVARNPSPPPRAPTVRLHLGAAGGPRRESPPHPPSSLRAARRRRPLLAPAIIAVPPPPIEPVPPDAPPDEDQAQGLGAGDGDDEGDGDGGEGLGTGSGPGDGDGAQVVAPAVWKPEENPVSPLEAAYLRLYQTFPTLPRTLWVHGRVYTVRVQMCITAEGQVYDVTLRQSATPALDALVVATLRTWRYRARLVGGKPTAFCHPMVLHYDVD